MTAKNKQKIVDEFLSGKSVNYLAHWHYDKFRDHPHTWDGVKLEIEAILREHLAKTGKASVIYKPNAGVTLCRGERQ